MPGNLLYCIDLSSNSHCNRCVFRDSTLAERRTGSIGVRPVTSRNAVVEIRKVIANVALWGRTRVLRLRAPGANRDTGTPATGAWRPIGVLRSGAALCRLLFRFVGCLPLTVHMGARHRRMRAGVVQTPMEETAECPGAAGTCIAMGIGAVARDVGMTVRSAVERIKDVNVATINSSIRAPERPGSVASHTQYGFAGREIKSALHA
ncbi:hypothetical protein LMG28614_02114 [Paraburkholderia ultramafica]|uniref:Uncharacterized protein n=1 Tax=Paraburkholderia ultramafica TaxID=1544867 RepID=A0A6S7B268_9BURK|nr:hypothetical protein LMG28614_02114 [Paraburkholderia ultramafica]